MMGNNRVKSVPITVTLDDETIVELREQAKKNDRSLSAYIRWLIRKAKSDPETRRDSSQKDDQ